MGKNPYIQSKSILIRMLKDVGMTVLNTIETRMLQYADIGKDKGMCNMKPRWRIMASNSNNMRNHIIK